jgi:hypothetical protein
MAQDNRERPAVKTTIVGGRPPESGKEADAVPRGIEILLKKAAIDESFRKILLSKRSNAADAIGLALTPVEAAMLKAIPETALERMVAATKVQPKIRQAFLGYAATVMLAALTAASDGLSQDIAQASYGIQPDTVQGMQTGGIRPDTVTPPSPPSDGSMMGGGARGGGASAEFTAKREKSDKPSSGAAGKWLIKDNDTEIKIELKVEGSKLTGTLDNSQAGGSTDIKDGKIEGNKISFNVVRKANNNNVTIKWTGTLSGDEIKFKRESASGGAGGMMGGGRVGGM